MMSRLPGYTSAPLSNKNTLRGAICIGAATSRSPPPPPLTPPPPPSNGLFVMIIWPKPINVCTAEHHLLQYAFLTVWLVLHFARMPMCLFRFIAVWIRPGQIPSHTGSSRLCFYCFFPNPIYAKHIGWRGGGVTLVVLLFVFYQP